MFDSLIHSIVNISVGISRVEAVNPSRILRQITVQVTVTERYRIEIVPVFVERTGLCPVHVHISTVAFTQDYTVGIRDMVSVYRDFLNLDEGDIFAVGRRG